MEITSLIFVPRRMPNFKSLALSAGVVSIRLGSLFLRIRFSADAIREIAKLACMVNESAENIGARRLHTIVEALLEDISFEGKQRNPREIQITADYVRRKLEGIVRDKDLSRYIL